MMTRRMAIVLGLAALLAPAAWSATYQVGAGRPYADLQAVAGLLNPGDVVEVDGDATYPGDVTFARPGTASAPIVIRGIRVNGRRPILSGGTNTVAFTTPYPYSGPGADHYVFEGFEVTGGSFRGIYHQADDLTVRDVAVHDCPAHGILGADEGSGSCTLEYVEVYACGSGTNQHQIYMATDEVNHPGSVFRMRFCYVHQGNGGNNVKSRAERNEIAYNRVEGAYYHELELIGPDGADPSLAREDSDVVGNVLVKKSTPAGNDPDFYVVRLGGDGTGETNGRYRFDNNTILCGAGAVFRLFDGIESVEMHNNVIFRWGGAAAAVVRSVDAHWSTGQERIAGSNNWVPTGSSSVPTQWTGTLTGASPFFQDIVAGDYRPSLSSPLIGMADAAPAGPSGSPFPAPLFPPVSHPPVNSPLGFGTASWRPTGPSLDIGAYQYEPAGPDRCVDANNLTGTEDGTPQRPFSSIVGALKTAASGTRIRIARGSYTGGVVVDGKRLVLEGGYPGGDLLDYKSGAGGEFGWRDPERLVTTLTGNAQAPVLTVQGPVSSGTVVDGIGFTGGSQGIKLDDDLTWPLLTDVILAHDLIEANGAAGQPSARGGGVYASGSRIALRNNVIRQNLSGRGAGVYADVEALVMDGNRVESNVGYGDHGGGVFLGGHAVLTGNVIVDNRTGEGLGYGWGGGVITVGTANLRGNLILANYAPSIGGGFFADEGAAAVMDHDVVAGNTTSEHDKGGAGVYVDGGLPGPSSLQLIHCTVAGNTSSGAGSGGNALYVEGGSDASAVNCIFWGNGGDDVTVLPDGSSATLAYTLSEENWTGTGNLSADPLFADAADFDFHLRSASGRYDAAAGTWVTDADSSPAIDAGDPASDFAFETMPNGGRANMGAFGNTRQASRTPEPCVLTCSATAPATAGTEEPVLFEGQATAVNCSGGATYLWTFGDGGVKTTQNATHAYAAGGVYDWHFQVDAGGETCTSSGSITVTAPVAPPVVSSMIKLGSPFRIKVLGSNLQSGIRVFIDGIEWTTLKWNNTGLMKIKGGGGLKALVPKNTPVQFRFLNPDGGEATLTWQWP